MLKVGSLQYRCTVVRRATPTCSIGVFLRAVTQPLVSWITHRQYEAITRVSGPFFLALNRVRSHAPRFRRYTVNIQ